MRVEKRNRKEKGERGRENKKKWKLILISLFNLTNNSSNFPLLFFSSPPLFYLLLSFFQTNNYESVRIHGLVLLYIILEVLNDQEQNRKHQTCTHVISQKWKKMKKKFKHEFIYSKISFWLYIYWLGENIIFVRITKAFSGEYTYMAT